MAVDSLAEFASGGREILQIVRLVEKVVHRTF
jgi:hypothetical protein